MNLIIVESPTKARTLSSFLGKEYRIEATMGHIRDLPEKKLGVEIENNFQPQYEILAGKRKRVKELKELAKKAEKIILATDLDREGEAIAYHVAVLLSGEKMLRSGQIFSSSLTARKLANCEQRKNCPFPHFPPFTRIVFHEITKLAIKEALKNPRGIDFQLVSAQQARRILDRLVGYKLSPLLWRKIGRKWLSAGRVQSVAVRLVVEREREREKFQGEEYWKISSKFKVQSSKLKKEEEILAGLVAKNGEKYEKTLTFTLFDGEYKVSKTVIESEESAEKIISDFQAPFKVKSIDKKEVRRFPSPAFTTSTLQQEANWRFGFSPKKTMSLAQRLYEKGLITYHRTDSVFLAEKFLTEAEKFIKKVYGEKYALKSPRRFKTKSKSAQEAHEAVRPTKLAEVHSSQFTVQKDLTRDHFKLYDLIWRRAVASQAKEAIIDTTKIGIISKNEYLFETQGSVIKFLGYLEILGDLGRRKEDKILPALKEGEELVLVEAIPSQHFTSPPPRYTEASLVKTMEKLGIGRPSTYAPTLTTIFSRQYVIKEEKKLAPAILGKTVNDFLVENFPKIIDIPFTAGMEDDLDKIAQGKKEWVPVIKEFYQPFEKQLEKVYQSSAKVKLPVEKTKKRCPKCGAELVIRIGRYGKFLACSAFPECKYTAPFLEKTGLRCPECGGELVIKKTKKGKQFYGCSHWPKCQFASWNKPR